MNHCRVCKTVTNHAVRVTEKELGLVMDGRTEEEKAHDVTNLSQASSM
jgi:hypothetical protein